MSRKNLEKIFFKALDKVKAKSIINDNISINKSVIKIVNKKIDLKNIDNLYIFAVGKAGFSMAKECENILAKNIKGGVVISSSEGELKYLKHFTSTHPEVSQKSIDAGNLLLKSVKKLKKNDYFIFLLSGGASAMIEKPIEGLSLDDFKKISSSLLTSGIDIKALNSVRKSISQIKGGKLANEIKAKGIVLVLSDVIGDDLNTIGSAPMNNGKFPHHIIGNNEIALNDAKDFIKDKVEKTEIITTTLDKKSSEAASYISKKIQEYDKKYESFCLLFGGETTTVVKANGGYGGRNQELALRLLLKNNVNKNISILCSGSDGVDGRSSSNGAFIDFDIYEKMKKEKLDAKEYLDNSDSNTFFRKLGYEFTTGITGTNVMDFIIVLKQKKDK
ncbi:MAG: hydroxypyruvate reductase [Arcobacter sp.]|nr:MAG: hydroxypyruvate reductase [Arcobacter sp.]